ncbi:MAG: glycosyltransferase family 4 protein [Prevotella sp.]|nr:glycosyltransferase family 4 protein [Prevotella sp.]
MRVLIVNTSEQTGGAAVAAGRLRDALNNNGVKAKMLVRDKETAHLAVAGLRHKWLTRWKFLWERWCIFLHLRFHRRHLFDIDIANAGTDITRLPEFREADVIHLHWVNQGMLSLNDIAKILDSGKPVVWTMHDIWPATAICHLTLGCEHFKSACRQCKYLPGGGSANDLAAKTWQRKLRLYRRSDLTFVACSQWLAAEARKSALLSDKPVLAVPNPIDTRVFKRTDKQQARERLGLPQGRRLMLFVSQRADNVNKGMSYLIEACNAMLGKHPELKEETAVAILGGHADELDGQFAIPLYPLGYVSDTARIVDIYNAADVFVMPSLSENLPNTIMEAMACGVPCVGFNVGGIPEEIDHLKNGYVARYRDADDLAEGICHVLFNAGYDELSRQAVAKVHAAYSQQSVALRYTDIYTEALARKNYNL